MDSFPKQDWLRLQGFLLRLHSAPSLAELPATILGAMRETIRFDSGSVQDDRGGVRNIPWLFEEQAWQPEVTDAGELGVRVMSHWSPEFTSMREAFFAASAEHHPHTGYYLRTGDGEARRLSEIISMRALRQTTFYNEISRQNRLVRQLTIYMPVTSTHSLVVALCRESPDFSEKERQCLDLLRPHIANAWHRAWVVERQSQELRRLRDRWPGLTGPTNLRAVARRRFKLSPREAEVLSWIAEGKTNAEIAIILSLTPGTVKFYVERILSRLGCETRTAAVRSLFRVIGEQ
jgi:DNA-binding CsgD family transcriptional regulator